MIPAQAPYEGGEPTMRKGTYSKSWSNSARDELQGDRRADDALGAHVIADGQTAETFGLMAELQSPGAATSRLSLTAAK